MLSIKHYTLKLWFDVEKGYITTELMRNWKATGLWFDVEKGYITTLPRHIHFVVMLWFDVEKGYITTTDKNPARKERCGLM